MLVNNRSYEIDYLRLYLIIALVICHAFAPFSTWPRVCDFDVDAYRYVAKFAYSAMLETFVFISGYLFYSRLNKGAKITQLVKDKFIRLLIPCYIFGLLYVALCGTISWDSVYSIFNGYGHLWFLPMLFWVFIIYYYVYPYAKKYVVVSSVIIFMLAIFPYPGMPMRINNVMYYLAFFHMGVIVRSIKSVKFGITSLKKLPFVAILYILLFALCSWVIDEYLLLHPNMSIINKAIVVCLYNICRFTYSVIGVVLLYSVAYNIAKVKKINVTSFAELCFGIYLFQEIVLRLLYYKFHIATYLGPYVSPWVACIVTLIISIILVKLLRQLSIVKSVI